MDELITTLYIEFARVRYRFKIFADYVGVERQLPQVSLANQFFSKADNPNADLLYDVEVGVWNFDAMVRLIDDYERLMSVR